MNRLVIGNKNYSSWSLRAWLFLKEFRIPFQEINVRLHTEGFKQEVLKYSPSGLVPAFCSKELAVWDSLAICEYVADIHPELECWPKDRISKSIARSVSYEMHSGFFQIRNSLPMNCRKRIVINQISGDLQAEIDRVSEIWRTCLERSDEEGDFLFGAFSIADAMFAPIVMRFNSYGIDVGGAERAYMEKMLLLESLQEWIAEAKKEEDYLPQYEVDAG